MAFMTTSELYSCCVESCKLYNKMPYQKIHFIKFPLGNKPLLKRWIDTLAINNRYILPDEHTVICNAHFKRKDYAIDNGYMKLYQRAIPSIYIGNIKQDFISVNEDNAPLTYVQPDKYHKHIGLFKNNEDSSIKITGVQGNVECDTQIQHTHIGFMDDSTNTKLCDLISNLPNQSMPIDVHLDNHRNISSKKKQMWLNAESKCEYKYNLHKNYQQQLAILKRKNKRLIAENRYLIMKKQKLQDAQIKYLELIDNILEAEEKLLIKGIDTSKYPLFQKAYDQLVPQLKYLQYDVSLERNLGRIKPTPINNNSVPCFSSSISTTSIEILSSDDDIEIVE